MKAMDINGLKHAVKNFSTEETDKTVTKAMNKVSIGSTLGDSEMFKAISEQLSTLTEAAVLQNKLLLAILEANTVPPPKKLRCGVNKSSDWEPNMETGHFQKK